MSTKDELKKKNDNDLKQYRKEVEDARNEMLKVYPDACTTDELQERYEVLSFLAPFVVVRRKSDNKLGTMQFNGRPRVYYAFEER